MLRYAVVVAAAFAACSASPVPLSTTNQFTLALIRTGPRAESFSKEERAQIFAGHFENMGRLAREHHLLLAGPYGRSKSDPALRGIFVLDTDDRERARQLAETDPGFRAGMFVFSFHTLSTDAALRAQLATELLHLEEVERSGRTPAPGEGGRGYVLLTAANGASAAHALAGHPAVLMFARLDGERALVLLDVKDSADASRLLAPLAERLGAFQLDDWFGSGLLVGLPQRARS